MSKNIYHDLSSERLNTEARLFAGCTLKEMLYLLACNIVVLGAVFFTISYCLWAHFLWGFILFFLSLAPALIISVIKFGVLKKNKPLFYSSHWTRRTAYGILGLKDPFLLGSRVYSIRRES